MLNKGARQLIHGHFVTAGIDYEENISRVKPYFHQLSQINGKSYWKYPRVRINGKIITLHRLKFELPSERLRKEYEEMKKEFVFGLTEDFLEQAESLEREKIVKSTRKGLTPVEYEVFELLDKGMLPPQIAKEQGCTLRNIQYHLNKIYCKGYDVKRFLKNIKKANCESIETVTRVT